ncbi:MAG: hypothetical protein PHN72_06665 [Bacilli bacterium]|nr:hypothetical protein [Bacilli bacterium]
MLNPNRVLCYQNDHLTSKYLQLQTGEIKGVLEEYKSILKQEYKEYYPNVDDSFHALDYFCLNNCIIRPDGTTIEIPAFKDSQPFHHDDLYEMDVHYSLIENKKVCQLYHLAMEKSLGMTINQFCRIYQGYVQLITYSDGTGIVLYNKEMISDKLWEYINFIQMNIPSFMIEAEEKKLEKVM